MQPASASSFQVGEELGAPFAAIEAVGERGEALGADAPRRLADHLLFVAEAELHRWLSALVCARFSDKAVCPAS